MREINVALEGENAMGERKTYLEQGKKTYKANLHCHSTLSDGKYTPQELKEHYKGQGYSILSITDHRVLNEHSDLNDEDFLLLTGFEQDFNEDREGSYALKKVSHINLIATRHDLLKKPVIALIFPSIPLEPKPPGTRIPFTSWRSSSTFSSVTVSESIHLMRTVLWAGIPPCLRASTTLM